VQTFNIRTVASVKGLFHEFLFSCCAQHLMANGAPLQVYPMTKSRIWLL